MCELCVPLPLVLSLWSVSEPSFENRYALRTTYTLSDSAHYKSRFWTASKFLWQNHDCVTSCSCSLPTNLKGTVSSVLTLVSADSPGHALCLKVPPFQGVSAWTSIPTSTVLSPVAGMHGFLLPATFHPLANGLYIHKLMVLPSMILDRLPSSSSWSWSVPKSSYPNRQHSSS